MTGVIKSLNYDRGFFFVTGEDGIDYFAHRTSLSESVLLKELHQGDTVLLVETEKTPKGWRATSVVPQAAAAAKGMLDPSSDPPPLPRTGGLI